MYFGYTPKQMAYIDNSDTKKEINDAIRGNAVSNIAPTSLSNQVIPVINVNPKDYRRCNIVKSAITNANSNTTLYTTPADKDFFLVAAQLSIIKDAANDMATGSIANIAINIDGASINILAIPGITLTANQQTVTLSLPNPIKLDRNSTIISARGAAYAAGVLVRNAIIAGYTVEA